MAEDVNPPRAPSLIHELSRASAALSRGGIRAVQRVCEIGKEVLRTAFADLVSEAQGAPLLNSKSADGTPISFVLRTQRTLPSGSPLRRSGRQSAEFLVKNQFIRAHLPGGCFTRALLQEPLPLKHGKTAHAILQACLKDWRSLRQLGHTGCAIEHYCFDRFSITAHERLWRQWHQMSARSFVSPDANVSPEVLRLTDFVLVTPCAAHDAQSAFRWSMHRWLNDKDLVREAYVAVEALRNSMDLILSHLSEWLALRISFVPDLPLGHRDQRHTLWQTLDIEFETAEILSQTLQMIFRNGRMHVASSCSEMPDLIDIASTALLSAWKFTRWNEARFLTLGPSARTLVAAQLLGLSDLVEFIRGDDSASRYFINGFTRLAGNRKTYMAECAFVSRVGDGVLAELMEDSRVVLQYDTLWQTLSEDMLWLASLPSFIWEEVASVAETTADELRSNCIAGGHISFHFFWRRVLQPAAEMPWSLARGDIRCNLQLLRQGPMPEEPMSRQMWQLIQMGFSIEQLVSTLELVADIGWTTLPAEQQHGSLAVLRRWHPEYGQDTLVARALLVHICRLLPSMSQEEKQLARLSKQLDKALARSPEKAGGRHQFVSLMFQHLRSRAWTEGARELPSDVGKVIFKRHARQWARQSLAARHDYEHQARVKAAKATLEIQDEVDEIRAQREVLIQRLEADDGKRKPILMSECCLEDKHLKLFDTLYDGSQFSNPKVQALQEHANTCPEPTPPQTRSKLDRETVWKRPDPEMPSWAQKVCTHREHFHDTALVLQLGFAQQDFWKVVYCVQSPMYLAVSHLTLKEDFVTMAEANGGNWDTLPRDTYRFHCNFADNASAADVPLVDENQIFVVPNLQHTGGMEMRSPCAAVPFKDYVAQLPEPTPALSYQSRRQTADKHKDELIQSFPWLASLDDTEGFAEKPSPPSSSTAGSLGPAEQPGVLLPEDQLDQVMKELDMARVLLAASAPERSYDDFKTAILGGSYSMHRTGEPLDAVQGSARGALAKAFCTRRDVQRTIRFDLKSYGQHASGVMARSWCHKMQHYYNLELVSPLGEARRFTAEDHDAYSEPTELTRLAEEGPHPVPLRNRIAQIRGLLR